MSCSSGGSTFRLVRPVQIMIRSIILIGVHMKASREASPRAIRTAHGRAIANFIGQQTQGEVARESDEEIQVSGPRAAGRHLYRATGLPSSGEIEIRGSTFQPPA